MPFFNFSAPAVFRIAGSQNRAQGSRCLMQMWNQNTEKSPGATQDILEITGGDTRHLKNRRGRIWAQDFPSPVLPHCQKFELNPPFAEKHINNIDDGCDYLEFITEIPKLLDSHWIKSSSRKVLWYIIVCIHNDSLDRWPCICISLHGNIYTL